VEQLEYMPFDPIVKRTEGTIKVRVKRIESWRGAGERERWEWEECFGDGERDEGVKERGEKRLKPKCIVFSLSSLTSYLLTVLLFLLLYTSFLTFLSCLFDYSFLSFFFSSIRTPPLERHTRQLKALRTYSSNW
jgi:hypothetical protein